MEQLVKDVEKLVKEEYIRAKEAQGAVFADSHHAYGVILEEVEEASDELSAVARELNDFWRQVRANTGGNYEKAYLVPLQRRAIQGAAELIQVAAMAYKAILTIDAKEEDKEC